MRPNCSRREAGFTLTELLVVLVLIGVFSGMMIAEMRGTFADALLRSTAREMISGLSLAGSRAVSQNQVQVFEFDASENAFLVSAKQKPSATEDEIGSVEKRKMDERVTVEFRDPSEAPQEESAESPEPTPKPERSKSEVIHFYPDGTADAREIVLRDSNGMELVLLINPITSRVRIQQEAEQP